jgi:NADP-dependent aldehyde dehydrogenase
MHPGIAAVAFTGSRSGGTSLWKMATEREVPVPVFAEMGSLNPVFVLPDAMAKRCDQIATAIAASVRLGVGQFCTCPGLVVTVSDANSDEFRGLLSEALCSDPAGTMLNQGIHGGYAKMLEKLESRDGVQLVRRGPATEGVCDAGAALFSVSGSRFIADPELQAEVFGPSTLLVECSNTDEMVEVAGCLEGQLTATVQATADELQQLPGLLDLLEDCAGRILFNGMPTGVEVGEAMHHGGPWPATTDSRWTSVGSGAIARFIRPVCWQDFPDALLPAELRSDAEGSRRLDGCWQDSGSR